MSLAVQSLTIISGNAGVRIWIKSEEFYGQILVFVDLVYLGKLYKKLYFLYFSGFVDLPTHLSCLSIRFQYV